MPPQTTSIRLVGRSTRRLLKGAVRLNGGGTTWPVAIRNALAVAAPLLVSVVLHQPAIGLPVAIGALQSAFADRPGPYRLQAARLATVAVATAVTATLAGLLGPSVAASVALLVVLALLAGLMLPLGPAAAQVGIAGTATAIVLGHLATSPSAALGVGGLVLVGGLLQLVLAVIAWPFASRSPEREAVASLYDALARFAAAPDASGAPSLGDALASTADVLWGTGHAHGDDVPLLRRLVDHAGRTRGTLLVLADYVSRLDADGDTAAADRVRRRLRGASSVLAGIADAVRTKRSPRLPAALGPEGSRRVAGAVAPTTGRVERAAVERLGNLAGQLRAMAATVREGAGEGAPTEPGSSLRAVLGDAVTTLRANLDLSSPVFRHAVRLAVVVAGTDLIGRVVGDAHAYWVPLTALVVLRPDWSSTFERGVLRVIGTLVGIVLASLAAQFLLAGHPLGLVLLAGVAFVGMRRAGPLNYGLLAFCISTLVVALLDLAGFPTGETLVDRSVDTLIGGAVAIAAVIVWPSWERRAVPARLAELVRLYGDWLAAIVDPDTREEERARLRRRVRLARTTAEGSLTRARDEPLGSRRDDRRDEALLAATHRLAFASLALDSVADARLRALPELGAFGAAARRALDRAATALDRGTPPPGDPLRPVESALADAVEAAGLAGAATVLDAGDRIVDAVDSVLVAVGLEDPAQAGDRRS